MATATGFLVLLTSPVPMVQGFGLLLVIGVGVAFACTLTAGAATLVLRGRFAERSGLGWSAGRVSESALAASLRGAIEILGEVRRPLARLSDLRLPDWPRPAWTERSLAQTLRALAARPERVLAIGALLAVFGWVVDTQTAVQSDITKLVPSSMPALRHLNTLEKTTGVSGEIDVLVHSTNVATAGTVGWMIRYENEIVKHFGYVETKGCEAATLCPALSLPDLFDSDSSSTTDEADAALDQRAAVGRADLLLAGGAHADNSSTRRSPSGCG